jgi:hypothetical protein
VSVADAAVAGDGTTVAPLTEPTPGRARRVRPGVLLPLLGGAMALLGVVELVLAPPVPEGATRPALTVAMVFLLFLAAESNQIHVQVRRQTHSVSFSEVPLVLGLFLLPPLWLLGCRLVAAALVFAVRRTAPPKVAFNLGLFVAEVGTAVLLFGLLGVGDGRSVRDWAVAYLTMLVVGVLGAVAVTTAIGLIQGRPAMPELLRTLLPVSLTGVCSTTLALVALLALSYDGAWLLLLILLALLVAAYRVYDRLVRDHADLGQLFESTRTVGAAATSDDTVQVLLARARSLLRAEDAALDLSRSADVDDNARTSGGGPALEGPLVVPSSTRDPQQRAWLEVVGWRDAVLVPLSLGPDSTATLQVGNSMGAMRTFGGSDLRLLQTLAAHAEVSWRNARLLEQARHDAEHDSLTGPGQPDPVPAAPRGRAGRRRVAAPRPASRGRRADAGWPRSCCSTSTGSRTSTTPSATTSATCCCSRSPDAWRTSSARDALIARLGGDEFAVLVDPCGSAQEACDVATETRTLLSGPFEVSGTFLEVGCLDRGRPAAGGRDEPGDRAAARRHRHVRGQALVRRRGPLRARR